MGTFDFERIERGEDRVDKTVIRGSFARTGGVAFAIAWIVERDRSTAIAECSKLKCPRRFIRTNSVEKDQGSQVAMADFVEADVAKGGCDLSHVGLVEAGRLFCNPPRRARPAS